MKLLVVDAHEGEGVFPLFAKGTAVEYLAQCKNYEHWFACRMNGIETYAPDTICKNGVLIQDYNPTELVAEANDVVELLEVAFEWMYVKNSSGEVGWIPAAKLVSIA